MDSRDSNLDALLQRLIRERPDAASLTVPANRSEKRKLMRALMNVRPPLPLDPGLLAMQDQELLEQRREKGVVSMDDIPASPEYPRLRLWQGDITRLRIDAIVNAANSALLGCFMPLHNCIDNAIHSAAGMQLREACHLQMTEAGQEEPTGSARITPGYNLPAKWVIHTVGPIVQAERPTDEDCRLLASCYRSCLGLAVENGLHSIAFCCISTGVFHFPNLEAAKIAVGTVRDFLHEVENQIECVVFNVFKDEDLTIYRKLLGYEEF